MIIVIRNSLTYAGVYTSFLPQIITLTLIADRVSMLATLSYIVQYNVAGNTVLTS